MTLNIKEVTLYQSGIGFFMADCPKEKFVLPVNETDINDVLKSLSVDGLQSVRFSSSEELERVLEKIGIDIVTDGALLSIIHHLVGLEVNVTTDKLYTGLVLGIDDIDDATEPETDGSGIKNEILVLKINDEIRNFAIKEIKNIELKDPIIQKDIDSYLDLIANKRKAGVVNLHITSKPDTFATWVMPVSSWRLSYRAFYNTEKASLKLFGISVIDNTTSIDWEKVVLRLVTGKPISFRYDLFNPLFIRRPEITRDVKGVAPMVSEAAGVFDDFDEIMDEAEEETYGEMGFVSGVMAPPPSAPKGGMKRAKSMFMAPGAKPVYPPKPQKQIVPTIEAVKLEIGSAIAYEVNYPLTVNRSQSALIPILTERMKGELCIILRDDCLSEPMDAIMLPKPIELEKGAATVYIDGLFAGDSMVISGTEFLAFRLNQDLSILKEQKTSQKTESIDIEGDFLSVKKTSTKDYTFKFVNRAKETTPVYLEITKGGEFEPKETPLAETKNYYRYKLNLKAGNSVKKYSFTTTTFSYIILVDLTKDKIEEFLKDGLITNLDKRKLLQILAIYNELDDKKYELTEIEGEIVHQFSNQKRIRENIVVIKDDENLKKDYLQKLKASEQRLEMLLEKQNKTKDEIEDLDKKRLKLKN